MNTFVKSITEGALVADTYCLGAHWIYDEKELESLDIDWTRLNDPQSKWHPNRKTGEFTMYGDQLVQLYEYALESDRFKLGPYMKRWYHYMRKYDGYMDAASTNTLDNIKARNPLPCGFGSEDLSVVGRIGPLLALCPTEPAFLEAVDLFTRATHYTKVARACAQFCARILWRLQKKMTLDDALMEVIPLSSPWMQQTATQAQAHTDLPTEQVIRQFGADCNAHKAMPGALHLLLRHRNDYRSAMIENAKAGGDSAARGMVAGMLMVAAFGPDIIPTQWRDAMVFRIER